MQTQSFQKAVEWLEAVPRYGHKDGLNNMLRIMERAGDPQTSLRVIHVAGTNGKGSCCAMLQQILSEAGYRTGLYTSPHLIDYRERIRVGKELISEEDFVRYLARVRKINAELVEEGYPHATFFEFLTAMAFLYFADREVDYVVLETGVGGRLDATNILEKPVLCLITSISLDHTQVLGDTVSAIAAEKAGIIKKGVPVVVSENQEAVMDVLCQAAEQKKSRLVAAEKTQLPEGLLLALQSAYQQENARAVLTTVGILREQGVVIPDEAVYNGLADVAWPGRMQRIAVQGAELVLDGAHNPDAAGKLGAYIESLREPVDVLFGALSKKDYKGVLAGVLTGRSRIRRILFAPIEGAESVSEAELFTYLEEMQCTVPVRMFDHAREAVDFALQEPGRRTVVCGSLYLVGEVLKYLEKKTGKSYV